MLNTKMLKKYSRLYLARKKLKEKYNELTTELGKMESSLIQHMITEEIDKFNFKGGITVSIKQLIWPKCLVKNEVGKNDNKAIINALKSGGLDYMVDEGYSVQTLASYLREMDASNEALPESFKGIIEPNPVKSLVVKKLS